MTEPSGLPNAVGIEAVECLSHGAAGMTILVTGRWRRRRPEWQGPAMLIIDGDGDGDRQALPAMPEPPSLNGAVPGTWRMSFAVPSELASRLDGRTWLQLGATTAPLTLPPGPQATAARPDLPESRDLHRYEVAAHNARREAEAADSHLLALRLDVERLHAELSEARQAPERLQGQLHEGERALTATRQRLHAETALREEAESRLAEHDRLTEAMRERARRMAERERELEAELRRMHRAVDEAQQQAAAARVAAGHADERAQATRAAAEALTAQRPLTRPAASPHAVQPPRAVMVAEVRLLAAAGTRQVRSTRPAGALAPALPQTALELERTLVGRGKLPGSSAAGSSSAGAADAWGEAQRRLVALEEGLARGWTVARRADDVDGLPELNAAEIAASALVAPTTAEPADETAVSDSAAGSEVDDAVVPEPLSEDAPDLTAVDADRLSAALERLRERHPPAEGDHPPENSDQPSADGDALMSAQGEAETTVDDPVRPPSVPAVAGTAIDSELPAQAAPLRPRPDPLSWRPSARDALPRLFQDLVREDPATAGRLVVHLLPAQQLTYQRPIAYDLDLGSGVCVQVTAAAGETDVTVAAGPRPDAQTQFRVEGELARMAKLLAAGPLRRRLRLGLARVRGDRAQLRALRSLVESPVGARHLDAAGVELDAELTLRLIALMLEPSACAGERFTLAHRESDSGMQTAALHVDDRRPARVTRLPLELPATTTVVCSSGELLAVLLGHSSAPVRGDERPLALVRAWLEHA